MVIIRVYFAVMFQVLVAFAMTVAAQQPVRTNAS
jgi:hypothetical protein